MKSGDLVIIRSSLYSPETGILRIADSGKTGMIVSQNGRIYDVLVDGKLITVLESEIWKIDETR